MLLGIMSRKPVAGVVWQTVHYLLGFQRLGYDVYYVEAHANAPVMFMRQGDDGAAAAAAFIAGVMRRFDLGDRWAFHALHSDGRCYGMSESQLKHLYKSAELIINLHGGTQPLPEHSATDRLVYLETDPVAMQIELHHNVQQVIDFLEPHCAFFTFAENYGSPDCKLPVSERFDFRPTRQPLIIDLWRPYGNGAGRAFSTVGSWRQLGRDVTLQGEVYHWSKHLEFEKFLDLPTLANQTFELALNRCDETEKRMLESKGWRVLDALGFSTDVETYRQYIASSRGEFTVAKDQNVRLRTGWFSDRSATYLAAGRPVITQETAFGSILPTGQGLFAFSNMEEVLQALQSIDSAYEHHRQAARVLAREYFSYDVVLPRLLADLGLSRSPSRARVETRETDVSVVDQEPVHPRENHAEVSTEPFPSRLVLTPTSRHPTTLPETTVRTVLANSTFISPAHYDVVCFPAVGWKSRSQRLQEILDQFIRNGHRVFYLEPRPSLSPDSTESFRLRTLAPNLFEVQLAAVSRPYAHDETMSLRVTTLLEALEALRRAHGIETAIAYIQLPSWGAAAMRARERWGWKVVYDHTDQEKNLPLIGRSPAERQGALEEWADLVVRTGAALQEQERASEHVELHIALSEQRTPTECWRRIDRSIRGAFKCISVVVVTFNNLVFTKLCLGSVLANTEYPNYEVIVVDNGSTDGTPAYLRSVREMHPHVSVVFNAENLGFARATNQGLAIARGEVLVLLNNDTLVPRGWLTRLVRHLDDPSIGLIGPVTNRISTEAQIEVSNHTYAGFARFARNRMQEYEGELFDVRMLAMYCLAMRRDIYERIGSLDERFEVGTFEDDDYAMRVRLAGHRVVCTEDVFVHHFGEASFGKLAPNGRYVNLLQANRRRFEEKWEKPWEPHQHRRDRRYNGLTRRIRDVVREAVPPGATVAVVSKGDEELLKLDGRRAWHFPQNEEGVYAGYHPADSAEAIARLEELRERGADYLLFPATAFWWLEHYGEFGRHLEDRYRAVVRRKDVCLIYELRDGGYAH